VCTGTLNQNVNLKMISDICSFIRYGENKYPAAYFKSGMGSVTIYSNGKYIMQGLKTSEEPNLLFSTLKKELSPPLDASLFSPPIICNLVCLSSFNHSIDLNQLLLTLQGLNCDVIYEPESFPGLILKEDLCTYNIFSSGKFVILGCKSIISALNADSLLLTRNIL